MRLPKLHSSYTRNLMPPPSIMTDASDTAVGVVLQQCIKNEWYPVSVFLEEAETGRNMIQYFRPCSEFAIKHFRYFVEGREFCIFTDHKSLTFAVASRSDQHSPRQVHHLDFISQLTTDIRHIRGADNAVADALLRIEHCITDPQLATSRR